MHTLQAPRRQIPRDAKTRWKAPVSGWRATAVLGICGALAGLCSNASAFATATVEFRYGIQFNALPATVSVSFAGGAATPSKAGTGNHEELSDGIVLFENTTYTQQLVAEANASAPPTSTSRAKTLGPTGKVGTVKNESGVATTIHYSAGGWGFAEASISAPGEIAGYQFAFSLSGQSDQLNPSTGRLSDPFSIFSMAGTEVVPVTVAGFSVAASYDKEDTFDYLLAPHETLSIFVDKSSTQADAYSPAIPEPSTSALMALGLAAVGVVRRAAHGKPTRLNPA